VVRERTGNRQAAVLIVDVSGSMRGEKVKIAAATVGAMSAQLTGPEDRLAVVAFWSDAAVLAPLGPVSSPVRLMDTLLRVPAKGLTNVGFGLSVGLTELTRSTLRDRTTYLLTDAVHNAGPDPRHIARRLPRLHVLLQTDGEHDEPLGRDLARLGHGRFAMVRHHRDVAPALDRVGGR
jgi:Mg-chelatase subunit ChlD